MYHKDGGAVTTATKNELQTHLASDKFDGARFILIVRVRVPRLAYRSTAAATELGQCALVTGKDGLRGAACVMHVDWSMTTFVMRTRHFGLLVKRRPESGQQVSRVGETYHRSKEKGYQEG